MAKVIKGTKDLKQYQVLKGPADTRQIRCTNGKCRNLAIQVPDGKGGFIYECPNCKKRFKHSAL
jgi:hypothetical protein